MNFSDTKPNLLLVFSDQHRWCDLGYMGNKEVLTSNFDAFADKAAVMSHCISNTPVCVPARGSLLTALTPVRHKAISNDLAIDHQVQSIAHLMNDAGYHTGYVGKWHLAGIPRDAAIAEDHRLGFCEWKVANCTHDYMDSYYHDEQNRYHKIDGYEPENQTDLAIQFIQDQSLVEPWGLVLSWGPPHDPYDQVPDRYKVLYQDLDPELRGNVTTPAYYRPDRELDEQGLKQSLRGYYAHITALDEQFGRLLRTLEETNQLDNTIVVYTSDHGDMLGSQGTTNKQWPYDESIRVPLMVYWQGHTKQLWSDELIGLIDLPSSLMQMMGLEFDLAKDSKSVDGKKLAGLFFDPDAQGQSACYIADHIACHQAYWRGGSEWRGIRNKRYTYACMATGDDFILYDNELDPLQLRNLVDDKDYQGIKNSLHQELVSLVNQYDGFYPYKEFVMQYGLLEEWNASQNYFGLPTIEDTP